MRLLKTPLFKLMVELYHAPLSSHRIDLPHWGMQNPKKKELGFLSEESWRIVGLIRDIRTLLDEVGADPETTVERYQNAQAVVDVYISELSLMLKLQVGIDLAGGLLGSNPIPDFCIKQGGQVIVCTCPEFLRDLAEVTLGQQERPHAQAI